LAARIGPQWGGRGVRKGLIQVTTACVDRELRKAKAARWGRNATAATQPRNHEAGCAWYLTAGPMWQTLRGGAGLGRGPEPHQDSRAADRRGW